MQIDLPYAVSEDELRHSLGLAGYTTGKGKSSLDPNIRAIEVYMCSVVSGWGGGGWGWGVCIVLGQCMRRQLCGALPQLCRRNQGVAVAHC